MSVARRLVEQAPASIDAVVELLTNGLGWPVPEDLEIEEAFLDWEPEELHLDPEAVARLTSIRQMRPLTTGQPFGVFFLTFEGGRLPVGALRRLVDRLVRKKRPRGSGTHPVWGLDDLLFVVQSSGGLRMVHFVAFKEAEGRQDLKVLSWGTHSTDTRLELVADRLAQLAWPNSGTPTTEWRDRWREVFTAGERQGIRTAAALATRMADVARDVRDEVLALYEVETADGPIRRLLSDVREQLLHDLTPERFADMYAQTMVYGLLTARITNPDEFAAAGVSSILEFENPFLNAVYARFREETGQAFDVDELGLRDLADQLARTDVDEVLVDFGAVDRRDDPVVHFYEEFLARYDPDQRVRLGAFYTPTPVVRYIVHTVDRTLKERFGLALGVADDATWGEVAARTGFGLPQGVVSDEPFVRVIDPATGTGTFVVEWLRLARENVVAAAVDRGASAEQAEDEWHVWLGRVVLPQLDALEVSLASYAVAHLKVSLLLPPDVRSDIRLPIFLSDTLAAPRDERQLEGLRDPVSVEGTEAERVKFAKHHSVVIGNPPYDRLTSVAISGWLTEPREDDGRSPLDDIRQPAVESTNFAHVASLYNLYVYFWRWALWKVLEEQGAGIVSFITASSWLTGPGFLGLRQLARELADEINVVDLGGDNRGTHPEENVFDIETPVAIVTLIRHRAPGRSTPARTSYVRIHGTRQEKLATLERLASMEAEWLSAPDEWRAPLAPPTGDAAWDSYPAVADLFPWQQPGCKFNRTWPIAPAVEILKRRWERFVETDDEDDRAACFYTASTGRNIHTRVGELPRLVDLPIGASHQPIVRYGFRSFERQWAFDDPRLAKTESPSLWASVSPRQIFMATLFTARLGAGPAATASVAVPDLHVFHGRGGKDVVPLYRDAAGTPNVAPAVLEAIEAEIGARVGAPRLFAYCYALLAGADYTSRFAEPLKTPGPRVPLTSDVALFADVADFGEELLWLHTFAERLTDNRRGSTIPLPAVLALSAPVRKMPERLADVAYDPATETLRVGDGVITGVRQDVWDFEVSGMQIVRKWLSYRTRRPSGRAASSSSPLDAIRPTEWPDEWTDELLELLAVLTHTLDLLPRGVELLDRVVASSLVSADQLPPIPPELRKPPAVRRNGQQISLDEEVVL